MAEYQAELYLGKERVFELPLEEEQMKELNLRESNLMGAESFNRFYEKVYDSDNIAIEEINTYDKIIESIYQETPQFLINYLPPSENREVTTEINEEIGDIESIGTAPEELDELKRAVSKHLDLDTVKKKAERGALLEDITVEYVQIKDGF